MTNEQAIKLLINVTERCLKFSKEINLDDVEYLKGRLQGLKDCLGIIEQTEPFIGN